MDEDVPKMKQTSYQNGPLFRPSLSRGFPREMRSTKRKGGEKRSRRINEEGRRRQAARLQAEDAASEAGRASCGRANTENDGGMEGGREGGLGAATASCAKEGTRERPQMAALSYG